MEAPLARLTGLFLPRGRGDGAAGGRRVMTVPEGSPRGSQAPGGIPATTSGSGPAVWRPRRESSSRFAPGDEAPNGHVCSARRPRSAGQPGLTQGLGASSDTGRVHHSLGGGGEGRMGWSIGSGLSRPPHRFICSLICSLSKLSVSLIHASCGSGQQRHGGEEGRSPLSELPCSWARRTGSRCTNCVEATRETRGRARLGG